jgi:hypothetical protein
MPTNRLWGEPYQEEKCKAAWEIYYSNFDKLTHRQAAKKAGVNVAEMYCYGLDKSLIDPGYKSEAKIGLKQLKKL